MGADRLEIHGDTTTTTHEPSARPHTGMGQVASGQFGGQPSAAPQGDRPAWLPEKFQTPEEMSKAYAALEAQFTQQHQAQAPTGGITEDEMRGFSAEFMQHGTLTDKTFASLEARGLPRSVVEAYISGQQAVAESRVSAIYGLVGGPEQYETMMGWAGENLPDAEIDAFNSVVDSGDQSAILFAVRGLQARYSSANGAPRLVQGGTTGPGTSPFRSVAELTAAMRDPKYKNDPAYRKDVESRLAVSSIF